MNKSQRTGNMNQNTKSQGSLRRKVLSIAAVTAALQIPASQHLNAAETAAAHVIVPSPWMIAPFILLLLAIALMPFISKHWWERYYAHTAVGLGIITVGYYIFGLGNGTRMLNTGIEYISFICLIGSLFVVAGGLHINVGGYASPVKNSLMLLFGAVIANLFGTTGASMILIRPFMRNNKKRLRAYHIVFFIFIVSNVGGALTPIGDPPLFLGYLKGVPFFWVISNVWHIWLISVLIIVAVFMVFDTIAWRKLPAEERARENSVPDTTSFKGMHNLIFLAVILGAVFIQSPMFLREALMVAAAIGSYFTTKRDVHEANDFNFAPIKEVGLLFVGIFATMVPALDWLEVNSSMLGITTAGGFYWGSGSLSSFLDNAPTYLNFLSASIGLLIKPETVASIQAMIYKGLSPDIIAAQSIEIQKILATLQTNHPELMAAGSAVSADQIHIGTLLALHPLYIMAISIGSVFFGANTYIGNAPNFMVKSIAEQYGVQMPTFLGYMFKYSIPILIPTFTLVWILFFA
jgi:Na+/H+ antiporter NhaD/arsenite permease-like protein